MIGVIKNIVANRNYGFIADQKTRDEYFFHRDDFSGFWKDLEDDLKLGSVQVEFDVKESPRGLRAANVRRIDWPNEG